MECWSAGVMGERCQVSGVPDKSGFPPHCTGGQVRFAPTGVRVGRRGDGGTGRWGKRNGVLECWSDGERCQGSPINRDFRFAPTGVRGQVRRWGGETWRRGDGGKEMECWSAGVMGKGVREQVIGPDKSGFPLRSNRCRRSGRETGDGRRGDGGMGEKKWSVGVLE